MASRRAEIGYQVAATRSLIAFMILVVAWGLNYPVIRLGLGYSPPLWLCFFTVLSGFAITLILMSASHTKGPLTRRQKAIALLLGLPYTTLWVGLQFLAITVVSPGLVSVLTYTFPIWVLFLSLPILKERPSLTKTGAALLGFVGVALIARANPISVGASPLFLIGLLVAAVGWGFAIPIFKRFFTGDEIVRATVWQYAGSLIPLGLWASAVSPIQDVRWSPELIFVILWVGVLSSGVLVFLWFVLLSRFNASSFSAYMFLVPVFAVASSLLLFGDVVDALGAVGIVAILISAFLISRTNREGNRGRQGHPTSGIR